MINKTIIAVTFIFFSTHFFAQKGKIQASWRALNDYESSLGVGDKPDTSYLGKANRNIDMALANDETKNSTKAFAYKARIMFYFYQYNLKQEQLKLEKSIADKNVRAEAAYGATSLKELEAAGIAFDRIKELDQKYFNSIVEIVKVGNAGASEDDLKLSNVLMQLRIESSNVAVGKYKVKEFEQASDYFYKSALLNTIITGKKDTSSFYNSCISAQKSKNLTKMFEYNKYMIDDKIASPYNYQTIYDTKLSLKDTAGALEYLRLGRLEFPNDVYLMNRETEIYLQSGNQEKALTNLQTALEKEPNNAQLQLVTGNVYDNLANPKGRSGKDTIKPSNYDDLVIKAANHYQKAVDLKPSNQESYFNALYNLGALYNNYGGTLYNIAMDKTTLIDLRKQKEAKSLEYYKKAIPYLEQALSIKPDDKASVSALRKLYYLTGNEAKGKEMNDKLKSLN